MSDQITEEINQTNLAIDSPTENWVLAVSDLEKPLNFGKLFGNSKPVEIEIGIGSGYFLTRYAQDNPDVNILGVDKAMSEVMRSADKARRFGIKNIRTLGYEALILLQEYIEPETIQNLHVYYSDPWPKKRHHKRRVWNPEFVKAASRILIPDGKLFMKTDVTEYFDVIDHSIRGSGLFDNLLDHRLDLEPLENDYETNFQRKAQEKGHPLHYQIWQKRIR